MKPFDYKERLRVLRERLDAEVADYIFRAKGESYEQIAGLFNTNVDNVKKLSLIHIFCVAIMVACPEPNSLS